MSYYAFEGLIPVVHPTAFVHPSAVLIGDVIVGAGVYIGPLASLRGDYGRLIVQAGANIQDGCIMHGYCDTDTIVGENGHIGHGAILHGCVIGRDALVGMNSVIMDGAVIGEESIVAAISFVKAGFRGEKRQLLMGSCRMRRKRLIRSGWKATVSRIRCASIASGDQVARYHRNDINDAYSLTTSSATSARG